MFRVVVALLVLSASILPSSRASAQIEQGDLRLAFDMNLLSFIAKRSQSETPGGVEVVGKVKDTVIGPMAEEGTAAGFTLAYAATPHLLPSLSLGLGRVRRKVTLDIEDTQVEGGDYEQSKTRFEVRPSLEVAILPGARVVPCLQVGLSYVHTNQATDARQSTDGAGPIFGVIAHVFAAKSVSLDLSLAFRALFIKDHGSVDNDGVNGLGITKVRQYTLMLNIGASYWL